MGEVRRYEDLQAWQKARELTRAIYKVNRFSLLDARCSLLRRSR